MMARRFKLRDAGYPMRRIIIITLSSWLLIVTGALGWAQAARTHEDSELSGISTQELVRRAGKMVSEMEHALAKSFKLLQVATKKGDVAAMMARNEAVTAMKGLVKLTEENFLTMQQKAAQNARQRVEHEYVKITIAYAKVQEFYVDVRAAGGIGVNLENTHVVRTTQFLGILPPEPSIAVTLGNTQTIPPEPVHASPYF